MNENDFRLKMESHRKWLMGDPTGEQAIFKGVTITGEYDGMTFDKVCFDQCVIDATFIRSRFRDIKIVDGVSVLSFSSCDVSNLTFIECCECILDMYDSTCNHVEFRECCVSTITAYSCYLRDWRFCQTKIKHGFLRCRGQQKLEDFRFVECCIADFDIDFARFRGCIFAMCDMSNMTLTENAYVGCLFVHTKINNLTIVDIGTRTLFDDCDFTTTEFRDCTMDNITFTDCKYHCVKFDSVSFCCSNLGYADWSDVTHTDCNFYGANNSDVIGFD